MLANDAALAVGHQLLQRFRLLIAAPDVSAFTVWLTNAERNELALFVSLVDGIRADYAAGEAALATAYKADLLGSASRVCDSFTQPAGEPV